ncbi:MAG: hypothetical protein V3R52_03370 [Candidatus Neomarinimicrobiota bacterium]
MKQLKHFNQISKILLIVVALVGLTIGMSSIYGFASLPDNEEATAVADSTKNADHDSKCGEGKCGDGKCGGDAKAEGKDVKCDRENCDHKKDKHDGKCGDGKCGGDEAKADTKDAKCGDGKCGGDEAKADAKDAKCGEGKCG